MKIAWRKIHRWLGLLVGFQVVAWMLSGLYFAWIPIEQIRGEHLTVEAGGFTADELATVGPPVGLAGLLERVEASVGPVSQETTPS